MTPDEYAAWANKETFLTVQIETPEGIHNADAIAAVPGVDMIFVGPGDLGLRLRQSKEMSLDEAWNIVATACKRHGKAFGGPTFSIDEIQKRHDQGAQLLVNNSEFSNFTEGLQENAKHFDQLK